MRVCLFGIDGLTFRILEPYMARGLLPNFQRVNEAGARGMLRSTVPPMTPPAWMSISTGLAPATHGIYDFWGYDQRAKEALTRPVTHRQGGKAIWNILSEWGKQVIIANVPLTYPPEPVNGLMVSGYMTPGCEVDFTYPAALKQEILTAIPGYQIDLSPAIGADHIGDLFAETLRMERHRLALQRLLLDKPWDFFYIVFTGADRIQHLRWDEIVSFHPQAIEYYRLLDEALGLFLETLAPDDLLLIVSDHGFQGTHRYFYLQEFLRRQDLLTMHEAERRRSVLADRLRATIWALGLRNMPTKIRGRLRRLGLLPVAQKEHEVTQIPLDWERTLAWIPSRSGALAGYADIFFDDALPEARIQALRDALEAIIDPETGRPLVTAAYREEAFGAGAFAPYERHLIVLSGEDTTLLTDLGMKNLWGTWQHSTGIHHPDGVLYLYGAGVRPGATIGPAHVYDIVPTILSFMHLPLPGRDTSGFHDKSETYDGKAITEAFTNSFLDTRSVPTRQNNALSPRLNRLTY
jgi:predicted AlkP superfamily phosphohydrolase/phosphomutase